LFGRLLGRRRSRLGRTLLSPEPRHRHRRRGHTRRGAYLHQTAAVHAPADQHII
jgi:hypothetical protein